MNYRADGMDSLERKTAPSRGGSRTRNPEERTNSQAGTCEALEPPTEPQGHPNPTQEGVNLARAQRACCSIRAMSVGIFIYPYIEGTSAQVCDLFVLIYLYHPEILQSRRGPDNCHS